MKVEQKQEIHVILGWTYVMPVGATGFGKASREDLANDATLVIDDTGRCRKNAAGAPAPRVEETFKWVIGFKEPDTCGEFAYWADEDKRVALEVALEADGEDIEKAVDILYEDPEATSKRFFEHGEYGSVELKLKRDGTGTCRLV